jgi:Mce-associated membrane protein
VAVPPAPGKRPGVTDETTRDDPSHADTVRLAVTGALVVVLLAALGTVVWLTATRGFEAIGIEGGAGEVQSERETVMSQTRQFMLRANTYGPDQLDDSGQLTDYRALVEEVITPKLSSSFAKEVTAAEQIVAQTGAERTTEVFSTGVSTIDGDSATALVAGTFVTSYPDKQGELQPTEPVPFRVQVSLVKTEGEWLVDDFNPITGASQ